MSGWGDYGRHEREVLPGATTEPEDSSGDYADRHLIPEQLEELLSLEQHIARPLQIESGTYDSSKYGPAIADVMAIKTVSSSHITALNHVLGPRGERVGSTRIQRRWPFLLSAPAPADIARKKAVSGLLRDHYFALATAYIEYTIVHATAVAFGDVVAATLAQRHRLDFAKLASRVREVLVPVVLQELQDAGEPIQSGAADVILLQTAELWSEANEDRISST